MKLFAHRGYSALYPENTMEAFKQAIDKGFDGIETDVHMTLDGELVLIHDEKINRTSNGKGYIKDMTLKQLRQYNYKNKNEGHYDIPTLKELLLLIKEKKVQLNIELKTDVIHYEGIEEKVLNLVREIGVEDLVMYSSFYLPSILKMRELDHHVYIGYLIEYRYNKRLQAVLDHHIEGIHPRYNYLNEKTVSFLKQQGIFIASWTIPNIKEYTRLKELGVDILISNDYFK